MAATFEPGPRDPGSRARRGALATPHGRVETPAFMPVGTRATVTGLTPGDLRELGAPMILGNTYHLLLRPGPEAMSHFGGLHHFMGWDGPILTDSGGFQIFSLSHDRVVTEEGARFRSYVDGRPQALTPERSIAVQTALGSDVMMVLDVCLPSTAAPEEVRSAMERTHRWALRSLAARSNPEQALFAIVQGGLSLAWRAHSAAFLTQHPFDGFAIGGLAVGDTREERGEVIAATAELLPPGRPRYLMGVGTPADILEAVGHGVDLFDCVIPTTMAWQGTAFTSTGRVRLTRGQHRLSGEPLDPACGCPTCRLHPRGYLHHLMKCEEPLGPRLLSVHNLFHYQELMRSARAAIEAGCYAAFARERLAAVDRHEHDPSARRPGARRSGAAPAATSLPSGVGPQAPPSERPGAPETSDPALARHGEPTSPPVGGRAPLAALPDAPATAAAARFQVVRTRSGAPAVLDARVGEVMHPVVGAAAEAEELYVAQSRLAERLAHPGPPLVLFDVGLGAGSNALAALRALRRAPPGGRALHLVSFERELGALSLAASEDGAARLGLEQDDIAALRALAGRGLHEEPRARWELALGDLVSTLPSRPERAELVFWDPFSPRHDPGPWSVAAFAALRERCLPEAMLFTYSSATSVRSALLLAGFHVGLGDPSGPKATTTAAAISAGLLSRPLEPAWLSRLARSSAPFPADAPEGALERLRHHPQFG